MYYMRTRKYFYPKYSILMIKSMERQVFLDAGRDLESILFCVGLDIKLIVNFK